MKVLFVTNMWPDSERPWYGTFIKTQADSLERLGVELEVVAIPGYRSRSAYREAAGRMVRLRRSAGFDVIHAHYGHSGVVARLQRAAPLLVSYCGDDLLGTPTDGGSLTRRSEAEAFVFRHLAHTAAATITKSAQMERVLPRRCRARNHVIPNGVDLERFAPLPRSEARARLGWADAPRLALFVGDPAIARKNHALAAAACRHASTRVPDLELKVVHGLSPADVPVAMSAADALVLTSLWEGSPNVVKEAMAAALPVVAVPAGDVAERLDGVEGCFVRPAEAAALGDAIVAAVEHGRAPAARAAMEALSLENVAKRVLGVYELMLGGSAASPPDDLAPPGTAGGLANPVIRG